MNLKIENFDKLKQNQSSSSNIIPPPQNDGVEYKVGKKTEEKIESQKDIYNYQKALHKIMSGENTYNYTSSKKIQQKDSNLNFSALIKNQQQFSQAGVAESPTNSIMQQQPQLQGQQSQARKGEQSSLTRQQSFIQFEYMPKKDIEGFENQKVTVNENNQKVVFVNFKMKEFPNETLNQSINALIYGIRATLCIPNRKYSSKVILVMSTTSADKLKAINVTKHTEKVIDITKICDIEYGIKNPNYLNIRGIDSSKVLSFDINDREEIECLVQFESHQCRDLFLQGFQHFVKQSHKTQLTSGNIFKLRQQIEFQIQEEKGKEEQSYDINEILDIFDSKVQLSISRSYLRKIYINIIKRDLDQQLAQQKITYIYYQKLLSDDSGLLKPINNSQFLEIIDMMLDRSELYSIFEKAAQVTDIRHKDKSLHQLTIEGFKQFILYHQKEIISMGEIEKIFKKILSIEKKNHLQIHQDNHQHQGNQLNNQAAEEEKEEDEEEQLKKRNSISFQGFVRYIYSKNNSIFNPKKESIYQNMNKPINEYYINSAKNIFHANFDIITMRQIAGFTFGGHEKYFPLLYALSRGARYIEVEVWINLYQINKIKDGEQEPIILYGPIMNSKLNVSEFLTQLSKQAFVINPYPLFLNIVPHCTIKQQFKLKYLIEKILKDNIYVMPPDYKERTNLPSPNDLKYKFILIGKLPHTYDGLIQEQYTHQDVIRYHHSIQHPPSQMSSPPQAPNPNPNTTLTQDFVIGIGGVNTTLQPSGSNLNQSYNQAPNLQTVQSYYTLNLPHQQSTVAPPQLFTNNSTLGTSQQQLVGLNSNQNRSASIQANPVDGTLLTPVHQFSQHNLPGDSLDQEMNELILQEEMEENVNVFVAAGYVSKDREQLENNILNGVFNSGRNSGVAVENIQSTVRRGNPSTVKAIDSFFSKNLEAPKFKKFIQNRYEDVMFPSEQLLINGMEKINEEEVSDFHDFKQDDIIEAKRGTFLNMKYHPSERQQHPQSSARKESVGNVKTNQSYNQSYPATYTLNSGRDSTYRDEYEASLKPFELQQPLPAPRNKQESLNFNQLPLPSLAYGISPSNPNISSAVFQMHCIRDYSPILASNTIESLYSMYVSKIQKKKPALWEIYDFAQRELNLHADNRLGYSVLSSYASLEAFTKYYMAMIKPSCKPSDSTNMNPIPFFNQGIQFVLSYFHTFDKHSLVYQSKFYENGGQTCGYILKPFQLRNHVVTAVNRNRQKSTVSDNILATHQFFNGKIDEQDELNYENEEDTQDLKMLSANKIRRHYVQLQLVSGFNLSTSQSDRVDAYVEVLIFDGESYSSYKTPCVDNNNMNPKWNHDIKFTVQNPSLCFIMFQVVNNHHTSLLGWYSIPFNCIRQGFRVVPLRDGFFNTIKNSFILCEISVVRESQGT